MHVGAKAHVVKFLSQLIGSLGELVFDTDGEVAHADVQQLLVGQAVPIRGQEESGHLSNLSYEAGQRRQLWSQCHIESVSVIH